MKKPPLNKIEVENLSAHIRRYFANRKPTTMEDLRQAEVRNRPAHRKQYNDMEWAQAQPKKPRYRLGDVVEMHEGGVMFVTEVSPKHDGWPQSYAIGCVEGYPKHNSGGGAWFYDGDFKSLVARQPDTVVGQSLYRVVGDVMKRVSKK